MMKTSRFLLAAGVSLAMAFAFFACDDGGEDNNDPFSSNPEWQYNQERYKYYDPSDPSYRCQNGVVERFSRDCGNVWYNPLKQSCNHVEDTCNGNGCQETHELGTIEACGNLLYVSSPNGSRRCQGGALQDKCGNEWCTWPKCGGKYYYPEEGYTKCENGVILERCGEGENETWYNYETHSCNWDNGTITPAVFCAGRRLSNEGQRCTNGAVEYGCGDSRENPAAWYNPITQSCQMEYNAGDYTYSVKNKVKCGG